MHMLGHEYAGQHYNKTRLREVLMGRLPGRSKGSLEFEHQNIRSVLQDLGSFWIPGYMPRGHSQRLLQDEAVRWLEAHPEFEEWAPSAALAPASSEPSLWPRRHGGQPSGSIQSRCGLSVRMPGARGVPDAGSDLNLVVVVADNEEAPRRRSQRAQWCLQEQEVTKEGIVKTTEVDRTGTCDPSRSWRSIAQPPENPGDQRQFDPAQPGGFFLAPVGRVHPK